jgi:ketosteroid isomerase-like protein
MRRIFLTLILAAAAASPALGQGRDKSSNSGVRNAIESASKKFAEVFSKGDAAALAAMYADGARVLPPNSTMVEGRQRIQELWQNLINTGAQLSLSTTDVEGRGDLAYEVGTYNLTNPDGKADTGKYVVVWRRQKDAWKLAADIWNSDLPASGQ